MNDMNDTIPIKIGVVLARLSIWCAILPLYIIILFFLSLCVEAPYFSGTTLITIFVCSLLAILFGHSAELIFYIIGVSHVGARKNIRAGLILGYIFLIVCVLVYFLLIHPKMHTSHNRLKAANNLGQLYIILTIYELDYNEFPKITPEGGNGVRDLYPLYSTGILNDQTLTILQPPGCALKQFRNPSTNDFNRNTIGLSYNSTAIPDDPDNPPLLADQGVWSGRLQKDSKDRGIRPREESGALVLFCNGSVEFIKAYKDGTLKNSKVTSNEWQLLKDDEYTSGYYFSTMPEKERHKNLKRLCALVFIAFIAFIGILYTAKIWRTRIQARSG